MGTKKSSEEDERFRERDASTGVKGGEDMVSGRRVKGGVAKGEGEPNRAQNANATPDLRPRRQGNESGCLMQIDGERCGNPASAEEL